MRVLVTGATGFIGRHLVTQLISQGKSVNILCHTSSKKQGFDPRHVRLFFGDILNFPLIQNAMHGCRQVFHLAGYTRNWTPYSQRYFHVNVRGTNNVLEAAARESVDRVVFTSSALTIQQKSSLSLGGVNFHAAYEKSKCQAEQLIYSCIRRGLDAVIVNPTRVFGPGPLDENNALTQIIDWYLRGKFRFIPGDGCSEGNYVYVDDIVRGHLLAVEHGRTGERYILGGDNVSANDLFQCLDLLCCQSNRRYHVPPRFALIFSQLERLRAQWFGHSPLITPEWVRSFLTDSSVSSEKAQRELGYSTTPLLDGLKMSINWLKKHHKYRRKIELCGLK